MSTSDIIALIAMVVSFVSLLLSYRTTHLAKIASASEKRTQAHSILLGVLLEVEELLSIIQTITTCRGSEVSISKLENKLVKITENIPERLNWLREKNCEDPIVLEEYKIYSLEIEARVKKIALMIREFSSPSSSQ